MRRQFKLPAADEAWLTAAGHPWETLVENGVRWLLIHSRPLPRGYTAESAAIALEIAELYPDVQIDMAYFHPALARRDGRGIAAITDRTIDGRTWQRWSRHRTTANAWRVGDDDVSTHLALCDDWLNRELLR